MEVVGASAQEKTAALLAMLWQKNLPMVEERLGVLRKAAAALKAGALKDDLRAEAQGVAHKMAGSLGMFGLPQATEAARRMEVLLDGSSPDASQFDTSLNELEAAIRAKDAEKA